MNLIVQSRQGVIGILGFICFCAAGTAIGHAAAQQDAAVTVDSPDGNLRLSFQLRQVEGRAGVPSYSCSFHGRQLVEASTLGLDFAATGPLRHGLRISDVTRGTHDQTYRLPVGKSSTARDHYNELVVALEEEAEPKRRIEIVLRAYDDGIAFRYRFPNQPAFADFVLSEEHSKFHFAGNPKVVALPLGGFTTSYETLYQIRPLSELAAGRLIGLPVLLQYPDGVCAAVTEANLTDYAGMYLAPDQSSAAPTPRNSEAGTGQPGSSVQTNSPSTTFVSRLSPWPGQPDVKVKGHTPHASPWRVLMIGQGLGKLIESNLILNLNEPNRVPDPSWIKPGKISFPWWHGYVVTGVDFQGGLNTATLKNYIDFCAESGIEYSSLDGFEDRAWYGGPIGPDKPVDITTAIPEIDLPEVLSYAKAKGVPMRIWVHWKALAPQIDRAFAVYEDWGIEGVMIDFMDRDDQEMVRFYHEVVRKAAQHHLTVNFHGAYKPTGIRRTWPNLLTREAVLNLEYNKFNNTRCPPEHNVTVPFVRMLAGPLDYHEGGFRSVTREQFRSRNIAPFVIGTRCHYLAMYVVYENPLPMVADHPGAYRGQPGFEFVTRVPTSWDETRFLAGAVGEFIALARRRGDVWYVGCMSAGPARELELPLHFLGEGEYQVESYADAAEADRFPTQVSQHKGMVTAAVRLTARLAPDGGYVARLEAKTNAERRGEK